MYIYEPNGNQESKNVITEIKMFTRGAQLYI